MRGTLISTPIKKRNAPSAAIQAHWGSDANLGPNLPDHRNKYAQLGAPLPDRQGFQLVPPTFFLPFARSAMRNHNERKNSFDVAYLAN